MTVPQVAHELNSLLDGASRFLRLALGRLERESCVDQAIDHLNAAQAGLRRMGEALEHLMRSPSRCMTSWPTSTASLAEEATRVIEACAPAAAALDVLLSVDIDASAAQLPAGHFGVIMLNGVRNAISACAGASLPRRVILTARVEGGTLILEVVDNGRGVSAEAPVSEGGHGIGLDLCREVMGACGGTLELVPRPEGGSLLRATAPCADASSGAGT